MTGNLRSLFLPATFVAVAGLTSLGAGLAIPGSLPRFALVIPLLVLFGAVIGALAAPRRAVLIGAVIPLLQVVLGSSLLLLLGIVVLGTACVRAYPESAAEGRRGGLLILGLGASSMIFGVLLPSAFVGIGATGLVIAHTSLVGIAASLAGPKPKEVTVVFAIIGLFVSLNALATPALRGDRTVAVLGENANGVGFFAAIGIVAGLVLATRGSSWWRIFGLATVALCGAGLVTSGSRGALLAALFGISVVVLRRVIRRSTLALWVTMLVIAGGLSLLAGPLSHRLVQYSGRQVVGADENVSSRSAALRFALNEGLKHPVVGVGLGRLGLVTEANGDARLNIRAHNVYAGIFAEAGVVSLAFMVGIVGFSLFAAARISPDWLLPLAVTVVASGISLEWWGASRTGPVALLALGVALGASKPELSGERLSGRLREETRNRMQAATDRGTRTKAQFLRSQSGLAHLKSTSSS